MIDLEKWILRRRSQATPARALDMRGVTPSVRDLGAVLRTGRRDLVGIPTLAPSSESAARELASRASAADVAALALTVDPALGGSLAAMRAASECLTASPLLLLDPVVSEGQVLEGRLAGADAVTLPVGSLSEDELYRLARVARSTLMTPVFLVGSDGEWDAARVAGARFSLVALPGGDLSASLELASRMPPRVSACLWADGLDSPVAVKALAGRADGVLLPPTFPSDAWPEVAVIEPAR